MALTPNQSRASAYLDSFETAGYPGRGSSVQPSNVQNNSGYRGYNTMDFNRMISSGSGGSRGTVPTTSTTRTIRKGDAPELPNLPTFKAPEMNKRALKAATQKLAAPGVRTLRETVQQAMGRNYENPNVRKMTLREALQGYGTGLEKVMSGAGREARSNQMAELDLQREQEAMNFKAQTEAAMRSYQNAWADYLKGEQTIQTSGPTMAEGEDALGGRKMGNKTYYQTRDPFTGAVRPL
jgi:hypothetical protein